MRIALRMQADLGEFAKLQQIIAKFAETQSWSAELIYQIELVLEEICINVVNYGFDEAETDVHEMEVRVDSAPESVTIEVADNGRAFDPLEEAPAPDLDASVDERRVGGLGVFLVKTLMDDLAYVREDGRNRLTASKRIE